MTQKSKTVVLTVLFLATLLLLAGESWIGMHPFTSYHPSAVNGVLDLRDWDLTTEGITKLTGDWEFYWNTLLDPSQIMARPEAMSGYAGPGFWNGHVVDGKELPGQGCATYVLKVLMEPDGKRLAIRVPSESTAFRLWVNGRELGSNGKVGTSAKETTPQYMPLTITIDNDVPEITLVMQVSNFAHRHGGMWEVLEIGTEAAIRVKAGRLVLFDMLSIGSLFTMGCYHILLYAMRRNDKSTVYFAGICLCFGIRAFMVGEIALTKMWPNFNWTTSLRLEYLVSAGILPLALLFLWEIYPKETSWAAVRLGMAIYAVFFIIIVAFPTTLSSQSMVYYQVASVMLSGYILYALALATIRRREGSQWLTISAAIFILTMVNDMLYFSGYVRTGNLSSLGFVIVCFAQSYVLAARFSGALTSVETLRDQQTVLNQQLTELNRGLEQRVSERTSALVESNRRLEAINTEIEGMEQSRKHLLANIAHDLRTPVTLIQGYVEAMLDGVIDEPEQRAKYLNLIAGKTLGLSHLIADLFELTQLESRRATFNIRPVPLDELVNDLYMKYETDIGDAGVTPILNGPVWDEAVSGGCPSVNADSERIDRVFSNLIYNALKFTPKGGSIAVSYGMGAPHGPLSKSKYVVINITDTGAGIAAEDLPYVFDRFYKVPRARTQVPGSGLGLSIAREIVELHGGRIWAQSAANKGSTFSFTLPIST